MVETEKVYTSPNYLDQHRAWRRNDDVEPEYVEETVYIVTGTTKVADGVDAKPQRVKRRARESMLPELERVLNNYKAVKTK